MVRRLACRASSLGRGESGPPRFSGAKVRVQPLVDELSEDAVSSGVEVVGAFDDLQDGAGFGGCGGELPGMVEQSGFLQAGGEEEGSCLFSSVRAVKIVSEAQPVGGGESIELISSSFTEGAFGRVIGLFESFDSLDSAFIG